jgi:hypothetical protein
MKNAIWTAALVAAAASAAAAKLDAPAALFGRLPDPPASLKAASALVRVVVRSGNPGLVAPGYDAVSRAVEAQVRSAGEASARRQLDQSGAGIDFARMQSDPAYARRMQAELAGMSLAQKMAMARRLQAAQAGAGRPTARRMAHMRAVEAPAEGGPGDRRADAAIRDVMGAAFARAAALHGEIDKSLKEALLKCPQDKYGESRPACTAPLLRVALSRHRTAEARALKEEDAAFRRARAIAAARVAAAETSRADVEAGGSENDRAELDARVGRYAEMMSAYGRAIVLGAGFWTRARCEFSGISPDCYAPAGKGGRISPPPTDAIPYK